MASAAKSNSEETPTLSQLLSEEPRDAKEVQAQVDSITAQANKVVRDWTDAIGPWAYVGGGVLFSLGAYFGFKRKLDKDTKITRAHVVLGFKALAASTILIGGVSFLGLTLVKKFTGANTLPEFNYKLKEKMPAFTTAAKATVEKVGPKMPEPSMSKEELKELDSVLGGVLKEAGDLMATVEPPPPKPEKVKRPPPAWARWLVKEKKEEEQKQE